MLVPKFTPERALKFTKLSVSPLGFWPASFNATKSELIFREIRWWISFLIILSFIFAEIYGIRKHYQDSMIVTQSICFCMGSSQVLIKIVIFKIQSTRFKIVTLEMEDFIKRMNIFERTILQRYVDKCAMFHLAMTFSYYTICVAFILGPTILPRPFPTFAEYPFKVESHPIHEIIYFQQAFVGIQAAVGVTIDCQVAFLLWYTGARFEILAIKLINIVNEDELKACIKLHDDLLRYGKNVVKAVRFIILTSIGVSSADSITLKLQFVSLMTGSIFELFLCCRPADNLMEMSSAVGSAAYRSNWINKSAKMKSSIYFLIQRSQKPVTISVDGIIPPLSLQYYLSEKRCYNNLLATTDKHFEKSIDPFRHLPFRVFSTKPSIAIDPVVQTNIKMLIARLNRTNMQQIVVEMETVIREATPSEKAVLEKYVNRSATLHICLTFGFYLASINMLIGPLFLPQPFPGYSVFPFKTDTHPIYEIAYFAVSYPGLQSSAAATVDCQVAFLLWFAGARFEMLKNEIDEVLNEYDLKKCIIKHNHILIYAENIINTVRYLIFTAVIVASILIVDSFIIKFQFLILDVVAVIQLYLNSNPAENLIEMSTEIGSAVYNLNWTDKSKMIWRNMYILMQRSQKPVILSVGGFLPALSLSYYMSYLSTCFSYFTTMKAMMQ
uniref:Odorant receptor n=1 Tax=Vespula pensylvanica TaxID=30213 RepID=A0A834N3D9_VESPE|nr:hypothetical protein H0235_016950 [Vespula pensylvanica]